MLSGAISAGTLTVHAALSVLLAAAAINDIRAYRIPNSLVIAIAALFAAASACGLYQPLKLHLLTFAAAAALGSTLFYCDFWGGGDAKLLAVLGLFLQPYELSLLVVATALAGGVLAAGLVASNLVLAPAARVKKMPYGVALAAGGVIAIIVVQH